MEHRSPAEERSEQAPGVTSVVPMPRKRGVPAAVVVSIVCYGLVGVASVLFVLAGAGVGEFPANPYLRVAGYCGLFLVLTTGPIAWALISARGSAKDEGLRRSVDRLTEAVRRLDESAGLSDDARRVLNRRAERELLCRAIEEDIQNQAWDAAIVLCTELADRFGYRADAEEFRARIELARTEVIERRVADAIARLDGLIVQRRWDVAFQESARIQRLYPESPRVDNLRARVIQARDVFKEDLERRFLEAAKGERVEEAMTLLKELDQYLTPVEGQAFQEVARGVVTKARENLGAQFKIAVQNRDWRSAILVGRRITQEFPNTRMAAEVRQMWDGILSKANASAQHQTATAGVQSPAAAAPMFGGERVN
ncbi:MAG: hypothetical protein KF768_08805 [Phycisphaeraceae bacterium]|nr:hypothetical protein [Phycisphaeraceae bacterium]